MAKGKSGSTVPSRRSGEAHRHGTAGDADGGGGGGGGDSAAATSRSCSTTTNKTKQNHRNPQQGECAGF